MGLTYWLYWIHNLVNLKLKKKSIPFKSVVIKYEKMSTKPMNSKEIDTFVFKTEKKYKKYASDLVEKITKNLDKVNWSFTQ